MPGRRDTMFSQKLYKQYVKSDGRGKRGRGSGEEETVQSHFSKPRTSTTSFNIHHYAYTVTYETQDFVHKNMDALIPEHLEILQKSQVRYSNCITHHTL